MPSFRRVLATAVLLTLMFGSGGAVAQKTAVKKKPVAPKPVSADAAFYEAVGLHYAQKISSARDQMKVAAKMAPRSTEYKEYLAELEKLVELDALDKHAIETPASAEADLEGLARHLTSAARSDRDKVRLIFRWVADL